LDSTPDEGNRLVLITGARLYSSFSQTPIINSVTQTNVTWNWLRREGNPGGSLTLGSEIWISDPIGASTPGTVITINYSTSEYKYGANWVGEYKGLFKSTGTSGVVDAHGGRSSVWASSSVIDIDDSGGPATASDGERLLLCNGAICANVGTGLLSSPTNGYSIVAQPYNASGRRIRNGIFEKIIFSGPEVVELQVTTSGSTNPYCDNVLALLPQEPIDLTHTTDSLLRNVFTTDHDTDSLLKATSEEDHSSDSYLIPSPRSHDSDSLIYKVGEPEHTTDSVLLGEKQLLHSTDTFLKGELREPFFGRIVTRVIPPGDNVGLYPVSLVGMSGNSRATQQLEYTSPDQEFVVGSGAQSSLHVIDSVIKKEP
jgi:hypothetical protein